MRSVWRRSWREKEREPKGIMKNLMLYKTFQGTHHLVSLIRYSFKINRSHVFQLVDVKCSEVPEFKLEVPEFKYLPRYGKNNPYRPLCFSMLRDFCL